MTPISNDKFRELTDKMLEVGGEWKVSMSKDGCYMTYDGERHCITELQADVMFTCIPRKCTANG